MRNAPYSLDEARKLCTEYEYLVGQSFAKDNDAVIECLIICPYDEASKKRFLIFYFLLNDAEMALSHGGQSMNYDVLVIARSVVDNQELHQLELSAWLAENKEDGEQENVIISRPQRNAI